MKFKYVALNSDQKVQKGSLAASSEKEAQLILKDKGWNVLVLKGRGKSAMGKELSFGKMSSGDLLFFVKHLAIILKSGIPLFEGVQMLQEQAQGRLKSALKKVLNQVKQGTSLADAMESQPKNFPTIFVQLVRSGERSGTLESSLEYLVDFLKKEQELKKRVKSAMLYPTIVMIAVFLLVMVIGLFVLPQILPLFSSLNVELPWTTQMLLVIAEFFDSYGVPFLFSLIGLAILIPIVLGSRWVRPFAHWVYLRIPIFGTIIVELNLARFFRVLATLMAAGMIIDRSLEIARATLSNEVYKKHLISVRKGVIQGNSLMIMMQYHPRIFPVISMHMLRVGERSGNLSDSIKYLAEYYEAESSEKMKNLGTLLEPVLLIFVGLVVAVVAFSIIGPIYSLSGSIR